MTTRRIWLGASLGVMAGLFGALTFAHWTLAAIPVLDMAIALLIGAGAGALGTLIRIKGATVWHWLGGWLVSFMPPAILTAAARHTVAIMAIGTPPSHADDQG